MLKHKSWRFFPLFLLVALPVLLALTSCGQSSSTASCAFVVGDGQNGDDARLHAIIYPGQMVNVSSQEAVWYVPCNSRNYIINSGSVRDANNNVVGDRHILTTAYTKSGMPIEIATTAFWTLNESKQALTDFYNLCFKYSCASNNDQGGSADFSTKGWNGMLGENFGPSVDQAAQIAAFNFDDSIWQSHDPTQYQALANAISTNFANQVRKRTGYSEDLFCGSGSTSGWPNPSNPGTGSYTCAPVRFVVDSITRGNVSSDNQTATQTLNAQRLANAQQLYGSSAQYWLGLQDTIEKCQAAKVTCVFNLGNAPGAPAVP